MRRAELDRLTIQDDFTRIRTVGPCQDLHERAFTGAVLTHEGVHLAGPDAKANALENAYAREAFANLA